MDESIFFPKFQERFKGYRVRYLPFTETLPSRVSIKDLSSNRTRVFSLSQHSRGAHYFYSDPQIAAMFILDRQGIIISHSVRISESEWILLTDDYKIYPLFEVQ